MIYYINLDRSTDRRASLENDLSMIGWIAERISAITPTTLNRVVHVHLAENAPRNRWIEWSVIASHLTALEALIASSDSWALILEDDIDLRAVSTWGFDLNTLASAFPADAGLVQLAPCWTAAVSAPSLTLHPQRFGTEWCTAAIWVRRSYAEQVLRYYRVGDGRYDIRRYSGPKVSDSLLFDAGLYGAKMYCTPLLYCKGVADGIEWTTFSRPDGEQKMHQTSWRTIQAQLKANAPVTLACLGMT